MSQQSLELIYTKAQKGEAFYQSKLLAYGRENGFETFINRKLIWPFLLGINTETLSNSIYEWDGEIDKSSPDYEQLQKDAERSLSNMKAFENIAKFHLQKKQKDVLKILNSFFAKNPRLRYIQGFHDVASIFLILFGNNSGYYMMEKAGKTYFRDFLTKDIAGLAVIISELVTSLLVKKNRKFKEYFECFSENKTIIFLVPWILTWFAHVFTSVKNICRIWDYILCTGPSGIIYLSAGVILSTKSQLIEQCPTFDLATVQSFFQRIVNDNDIDIQQSIKWAIRLEESVDLQALPAYKSFEADSIFLRHNFELDISIHRVVKQYNTKEKARQETIIKSMFAVSSFLLIGGYLYLKYAKKS